MKNTTQLDDYVIEAVNKKIADIIDDMLSPQKERLIESQFNQNIAGQEFGFTVEYLTKE